MWSFPAFATTCTDKATSGEEWGCLHGKQATNHMSISWWSIEWMHCTHNHTLPWASDSFTILVSYTNPRQALLQPSILLSPVARWVSIACTKPVGATAAGGDARGTTGICTLVLIWAEDIKSVHTHIVKHLKPLNVILFFGWSSTPWKHLTIQCNVSPITGFVRHTKLRIKVKVTIFILAQWAMIRQF